MGSNVYHSAYKMRVAGSFALSGKTAAICSPLQLWVLRLDEEVADFFVGSLRKIFVVLADADE